MVLLLQLFHKTFKTRPVDKEQTFACLNAVLPMSSHIPSLLKYVLLSLKQPEDTQDSDNIPNVSSTFWILSLFCQVGVGCGDG